MNLLYLLKVSNWMKYNSIKNCITDIHVINSVLSITNFQYFFSEKTRISNIFIFNLLNYLL